MEYNEKKRTRNTRKENVLKRNTQVSNLLQLEGTISMSSGKVGEIKKKD